jgi:hypothetical protein
MVEIRDKHGNYIKCENAEEAIAVLKHLSSEQRKSFENSNMPLKEVFSQLILGPGRTPYWTRENFFQFIEALGDTQTQILSQLVEKHRISDAEMRKIAGVKTNLELGGILSGISKQAGSHNIPARAVYTIENEAQGGETTKSYVVAVDFLKMAMEMNWPP